MKRVSLAALFGAAFVFALILAGCGGGGMRTTSTMPTQTAGTMTTLQFGDAPNDPIAKFELTINSIVLKGANGTADTANLLASPIEVEFSHLAGTLEPVSVGHLPPGTYSGAVLMVSNPEIVVVNNGVPTKIPVTLTNATVNVTFTTPITVTSTPLFVNFDLDLANSVTLTGNPITSATVNPMFTVTTSMVPPNEDNEDNNDGEFDEIHGSVTAINAPNFTIMTHSGASITFLTDMNTRFKDGITQLTDLKVGDIVEVEGVTKPDGTKLATKVEREGQQNGREAEGLISNLDNPLTKITIIHQMGSDNMNATTIDITVNSSTVFSARSDHLDIVAPAFDATHIGKGQRIEADSDSSVTPLVASKIKLREQVLHGTVAASPAPTSSGFTLNVSPTSAFGSLSGATTVAVTFANGSHMMVTPTPGMNIRVRGLVFVNGSTYTMIAVRGDNHDD